MYVLSLSFSPFQSLPLACSLTTGSIFIDIISVGIIAKITVKFRREIYIRWFVERLIFSRLNANYRAYSCRMQ